MNLLVSGQSLRPWRLDAEGRSAARRPSASGAAPTRNHSAVARQVLLALKCERQGAERSIGASYWQHRLWLVEYGVYLKHYKWDREAIDFSGIFLPRD